jgi:nicotinate-nucleotide adenylyltransferase
MHPIASNRARLGWLRSGLKGERWASVSDWELKRQAPSYSVDTARRWRALDPGSDLYWILGSDQWVTLSRWKDYRKLAQMVKFLVFPRPEIAQPHVGMKMKPIALRFDISATTIRNRLRSRLSVRGLVLRPVEKSLLKCRFYR